MAYDGIVINSIIKEIKTASLGGRVVKVQQPDRETITLTMKGFSGQTKIIITANASLPLVYISDSLPQAPITAPAFCMLLRKHIQGGKLVDIKQPGFDRIYDFVFEHMDEMGDISERHFIVEIMGRQSNIILTDSQYVILDCIKRVMPDLTEEIEKDNKWKNSSAEEKDGAGNSDKKSSDSDRKSSNSERIIYPGQVYITPDSQGKFNIQEGFGREQFEEYILSKKISISKAISFGLAGFSKGFAEEILFRTGIDSRKTPDEMSSEEKDRLFDEIRKTCERIEAGEFDPCTVFINGEEKDYHAFPLTSFKEIRQNESMSQTISDFYREKEKKLLVRSKSADIRKMLQTLIERTSRKLDLQRSQLADTEDRDKFRVYGELINAFGYGLKGGEDSLTCVNYYDNQEITIPIDPDLSAQGNSQKYFEKYNKKKRTFTALTEFIEKTERDLEYLVSAKHSLDIAETAEDIAQVRRELEMSGMVKARYQKSGKKVTNGGSRKSGSEPMHFVSSDGYDIYVGKNNLQNDELSFQFASGRDIWFHAKQAPGSHVIVKVKDGDTFDTVPDRVFEEAAAIAAYYSTVSSSPKVEVDYTERKNLKKPPQSNPGYVIYHTNYSITVAPGLPPKNDKIS